MEEMCSTAIEAMTGAIPMPTVTRHEPTGSWVVIDVGWLADTITAARDAATSSMGETRDELGFPQCGCLDCEVRRTISHLLPRILVAYEDGLVGFRRLC